MKCVGRLDWVSFAHTLQVIAFLKELPYDFQRVIRSVSRILRLWDTGVPRHNWSDKTTIIREYWLF